MIHCIWYPSGGFGHFVNAMICMHGENFARPNGEFTIADDGNSHALPLLIEKYCNKQPFHMPCLDSDLDYTVLIDNGINDESMHFLVDFPGCHVIKVCYDDRSWPVIAYAHIVKALRSDLEQILDIDRDRWPVLDNWVQREKYFLYLRDHYLRTAWRRTDGIDTLPISCLYVYQDLVQGLRDTGICVEGGAADWYKWFHANHRYISPVLLAQQIIWDLNHGLDRSLHHITELWTQAVIYYYLYLEYGQEVPHNDFANFFASIGQIRNWLHS